MRLKPYTTTDNSAAAPAALATVLDICTVSRSYPDRPLSTLERVDLDTEPRSTREDAQ